MSFAVSRFSFATVAATSAPPTGPGGEAVSDGFQFVHQPLAGDGSITVRVTSLAGLVPSGLEDGEDVDDSDSRAGTQPGLEEWTKAGLMLRENLSAGSPNLNFTMSAAHSRETLGPK